MSFEVDSELRRFEELIAAAQGVYQVEKLCEWAYKVAPGGGAAKVLSLPAGKSIGLTLLGLTHGNEIAGVAVINELLRLVLTRTIEIEFPVVFALGNPWAARKNQRFLEKDLNRSFASSAGEALEEKRAGALEGILKNTAYLLDFHQTRERSETPFFIFPYTKPSFEFARHIAPNLPIVTHWGDPFSSEGRCSDEFVNEQGGVGITVELGQNGFDAYQVSAGCWAALRAIAVVHSYLSGAVISSVPGLEKPLLYTWAAILPFPAGDVALDPGWYNFKQVNQGQRLGVAGGREFSAEVAGWTLFPQYPKAEDPRRPTELVRIMRRVEVGELPNS